MYLNRLIDDIITNGPDINSIYSNFIKLLLSDGNIINNPTDTNRILDRITFLTDIILEGNDITLSDDDKKYLNLNKKQLDSMINSEKIGFLHCSIF